MNPVHRRALYYVLDDVKAVREAWERRADTGQVGGPQEGEEPPPQIDVSTYAEEPDVRDACKRGRPDVVVLDVILGDDPTAGLRLGNDLLSDGVPFVVLHSATQDKNVERRVEHNPQIVFVPKGRGDDPLNEVEEGMRGRKPLTWLSYRAMLEARSQAAALIQKAYGSDLSKSLAHRLGASVGEPAHLVKLFLRNALAEHIRQSRTGHAEAIDVYRLTPETEKKHEYGNILRKNTDDEQYEHYIVLTPVCDLVPGRPGNPPGGLLTFRCWSADEFAELVETTRNAFSQRKRVGGSPTPEQPAEPDGEERLADTLWANPTVGRVKDEMVQDNKEWCYVLPSLDGREGVLIVDFRRPLRLEYQSIKDDRAWEVRATVEREWALHMLHKFSRWAGRLGVQDIDAEAATKAISGAIQGRKGSANA